MSIFLKLGQVPWQTHRTNPFFPIAVLLSLFAPVAKQEFQTPHQFVPDLTECRQLPAVISGFHRRVWQSPVKAHGLPEEHRAHLLGAKGDHRVYGRSFDGVKALGLMARDVDAALLEYPHGLRADGRRSRSRRRYPDSCRGEGPCDPFGHLAAGGVGDAEEQDMPWTDC